MGLELRLRGLMKPDFEVYKAFYQNLGHLLSTGNGEDLTLEWLQ